MSQSIPPLLNYLLKCLALSSNSRGAVEIMFRSGLLATNNKALESSYC